MFLILAIAIRLASNAQQVNEPGNLDSNWSRKYQPFRIAGNLYYVGTYDLASYLITSTEGHILVNTGLASSATQIKNNIEQLGFKFSDLKILLTTQAHYDHMGAMSVIKEQTGAKFYVTAGDSATAATGGATDYELGKYGATYQPIKPDRILHDKETIRLGDAKLVVLNHPGHTKGSCSFMLETKDSARTYKVLIANMPSIITDRPFEAILDYPNISADYGKTLHSMKKLSFDIWVASHASQFNLHKKHQPADGYQPLSFADKAGFYKALKKLQNDYDEKIKQDKKVNNSTGK